MSSTALFAGAAVWIAVVPARRRETEAGTPNKPRPRAPRVEEGAPAEVDACRKLHTAAKDQRSDFHTHPQRWTYKHRCQNPSEGAVLQAVSHWSFETRVSGHTAIFSRAQCNIPVRGWL